MMKIVCFVLGYFTIKLGYILIDSGAKGNFKFSANLGNLKENLTSISPGLLFVFLGVVLIGYAMYVEKGVEQRIDKGLGIEKIQKPNPSVYEGQLFKEDTIKNNL